MPWNEPGKDDKDDKSSPKDPWGGNRKDNRNKNQGPPDIDEALRKLRMKLKQAFAGKSGKSQSGNEKRAGGFNWSTVGVVVLIAIAIWALSGIYIVGPADQAVVLRFGRYVKTVGPGPHWIPRFISQKTIVNVKRINTLDYSVEVLTRDTNIINVQLVVQYVISNPKDYLYNITNAQTSLEQATASAVRYAVGQIYLSDVLPIVKRNDENITEQEQVPGVDEQDQAQATKAGQPHKLDTKLAKKIDQAQQDSDNKNKAHDIIRDEIARRLKATMILYNAGIEIKDVTLQHIKPPQGRVSEAYDDANRSREDEKRVINQAKAYSADVRPKALGEASRIVLLAQANQQKIVLDAEGNTASFSALLPEYLKAPVVTRERMYIDTIQSVLNNSSKILVDAKSGNLLYLPLDRLVKQSSSDGKAAGMQLLSPSTNKVQEVTNPLTVKTPNSPYSNDTLRSTIRSTKREY